MVKQGRKRIGDGRNTRIWKVPWLPCQDWERVQEDQHQKISIGTPMKKWCKPPPGWVKVNVDAACNPGADHIGVGCVVRDEGHYFRARINSTPGRMQAREAETLSFKEALTWMKGWRTTRCIFEMDAKLVVEAVHGPRKNSNFHVIIEDCIEILKHFEEVLVSFDRRFANRVAHMLAQATHSMPCLVEWDHTAPEFICNLIDEES